MQCVGITLLSEARVLWMVPDNIDRESVGVRKARDALPLSNFMNMGHAEIVV